MTTDHSTTIRSHGGPLQIAENEIEAARTAYLKAYDAYIQMKTVVNHNAMYKAWEDLKTIKAQYREGRKVLLAYAIRNQRRPS